MNRCRRSTASGQSRVWGCPDAESSPYARGVDPSSWWRSLGPTVADDLAQVWIPVGLPGFSGEAKHKRREVLDGRFGADGYGEAAAIALAAADEAAAAG